MLANSHLNQEIKDVEKVIDSLRKEGKVFEASSLKVGVLTLKLLQNLRANDVLQMRAAGISLQDNKRDPKDG